MKGKFMQASDIHIVAVVGTGVMGHGIAQEFATKGYQVHLLGRSDERLQFAPRNIESNLSVLATLGQLTSDGAASALQHIRTGTVLPNMAGEADVVVEAVAEDLAVKMQVLTALDGACPPRTILASTTSSLLPSALAAATRRPDKVLVTHYFNPPGLMPLIEIVRGRDTSDETLTTIRDLLRGMGKHLAVVQKEVPGFIGNGFRPRSCVKALWIVEKGVATPADVDAVIKYSFAGVLGWPACSRLATSQASTCT
jgi:3-hydroxybutyryl-CoA dehydrogenase